MPILNRNFSCAARINIFFVDQVVLGELRDYDTTLDEVFVKELLQLSEETKPDFPVESVITMCADEFYEGTYVSSKLILSESKFTIS